MAFDRLARDSLFAGYEDESDFKDAVEVVSAKLHEGKAGTPTMGGFIICISVSISTILWAQPNVYVYTALFVYLGSLCSDLSMII